LQSFAPNTTDISAGLHAALDAGASSAMVTLGDQGVAWMHTKQRSLQTQASFPVKALDTTGAGDVFHAALCFALAELKPDASAKQERQAIRFACAAAALKCTQRHGALGAPTRAEVLRFLDAQVTPAEN
jgi:sulfofructose kinase